MSEFESTSTVEEQSADQQEAFLDGWESETPETEQAEDQSPVQEEGAQEEQNDGSEGAEADSGHAEQDQAQTTGQDNQEDAARAGQEAPQTWIIKHMGEERTLSISDVTPELLQKGLDYDRVRSKYDEAKPVIETFTQFARQANMSVADYVKRVREEAKKAGGMSDDEAKRTVELEDREAAVSARESAQQEGTRNEEDRRARVAADLAEFQNSFPDIYARAKDNPGVIPQSVWDEVNGGRSLTAAYARYAVAQANEQAQAAQQAQQTTAQNQRNAQRSTGSMGSAGSDTKPDAFLDGFGG